MRFALKERKALHETENKSQPAVSFKVKTSPQNFLDLTPSDREAHIDARAAAITSAGPFSQEKAGDMFLTINPSSGRIIDHSGRARSKAAVNKKDIKEIEITIRLPEGHKPIAWEALPDIFRQQKSSNAEGTNTVSKSSFHPVELKDTTRDEDPLQIRGASKIFSDEIMPAATLPNGYQRPAMKTKDAEAAAKAFIKAGLLRYADSVKRNLGASDLDTAIAKSGLGQNKYVEKNAQDFQKILDSKYSITDEQGELTFSFMDDRYNGKFWSRQPVGDISINKK